MSESLAAWFYVSIPLIALLIIGRLEINRVKDFFTDWIQRVEDRVSYLERWNGREL